MTQNTRYAKWDANSGATTFTQTDEPVGLPPSSQMPRPGPVKRFVQWLRGCVSRKDFLRAMEETRAATIEMIGSTPSAHGGTKSGPWVVHMTWPRLTEPEAERLRKVMSDLKKGSDVKFRLQEPPKNDDAFFEVLRQNIAATERWFAAHGPRPSAAGRPTTFFRGKCRNV